jgi:hypothetical protein
MSFPTELPAKRDLCDANQYWTIPKFVRILSQIGFTDLT